MAKKTTSQPLISDKDQLVLDVTAAYRSEAESARRDRLLRNRINWDVYYGRVDWSYKQEGQSAEHLPKMAMAAEQVRAFVKKALVAFGSWYQVKTPNGYMLQPEQVQALMKRFLDRIVVARNEYQPIETVISNAVMQGFMESLIVLKVHGGMEGEKVFQVEPGDPIAGMPDKLIATDNKAWRLRIDVIPTEDYFPDPTGRNLYKLHEVERDYMDVYAMAEAGVYDMAVCKALDMDFEKDAHNKRPERTRNQNPAPNPRNRRRVVITEGWGTILGPDGLPVYKDCVWAIANHKYVIRRPEPFPLWTGEDPFIDAPLLQNPHTVWSKALYDDVASLNIALDELYNLILDGGLAAVWGVRQVRPDWLVDERSISGGIPQTATLAVNDSCPADGKVVETVTTSQVPAESLAVLNLTNAELNSASLVNDLRVGTLPTKNVKATEAMLADQSSNALMDSLSGELERNIIAPLLRKCWFTIIQFADDIPADDVVETIGLNAAFQLAHMTPAKRFSALAKASFNVNGLSGTLTQAREFQKLMALLQAVAMNPILLESFVRNVSGDKALMTLLRMLNINPTDLELTPEEQAQVAQKIQNMSALQGMVGSKGGQKSPDGVDRSVPNEARASASGNVEQEMGYGNQ